MKTYWLHGKLGSTEPLTPTGSILMAEIEGQSEEEKARFDKNMSELRNLYTPVPIRKASVTGFDDGENTSKSNIFMDDPYSENRLNIRHRQSGSSNEPTTADVYNRNIEQRPRRINGKNVRPNSKTCHLM